MSNQESGIEDADESNEQEQRDPNISEITDIASRALVHLEHGDVDATKQSLKKIQERADSISPNPEAEENSSDVDVDMDDLIL